MEQSNPVNPTDPALIDAVRNIDDKQAWDRFAFLYQPVVQQYIARFRIPRDSDDLIQEVFKKLVVVMPDYRLDHGKGRFRGWLRRVTDNVVLDALDAAKRRREEGGIVVEPSDTPFSEQGEAVRELEWRRATFDVILKRLRAEYSDRPTMFNCFEQTIVKGRKGSEVAAENGMTRNNVYVTAHRVMSRLRELAAEYAEKLEAEDAPASDAD